MSEIVKKGWDKYLLQLQLNPLRTKAITSGVLIGSSDIIAQKITGVKKLQFRRVLLLMLYGLLYSGPFGHFFHKWMDLIFKGKKGNKTVAKKLPRNALKIGFPNVWALRLVRQLLVWDPWLHSVVINIEGSLELPLLTKIGMVET
ncbi:Peroxisomal membrane protein PMP22 [Camellia lanceoleosa]|uniref:Peroxisomal membrane protein PMP22 n=1 Tax=Camellia lanceoleosa TaxID=1840588 RepID=A0ACC0FCX8_9ERIC|nr:Peroxisomal membrane protein PMP22 [Camellia lanceoleosa]